MKEHHGIDHEYSRPRKKEKKLWWPNDEKRCEERTDTSSLPLTNISKNRAHAEMHKNQFKRWYPEKHTLRCCTLHERNMKKD